jgi:hypothetical protein
MYNISYFVVCSVANCRLMKCGRMRHVSFYCQSKLYTMSFLFLVCSFPSCFADRFHCSNLLGPFRFLTHVDKCHCVSVRPKHLTEVRHNTHAKYHFMGKRTQVCVCVFLHHSSDSKQRWWLPSTKYWKTQVLVRCLLTLLVRSVNVTNPKQDNLLSLCCKFEQP